MNRLKLSGQYKKPLTGRKRTFSSELRYPHTEINVFPVLLRFLVLFFPQNRVPAYDLNMRSEFLLWSICGRYVVSDAFRFLQKLRVGRRLYCSACGGGCQEVSRMKICIA